MKCMCCKTYFYFSNPSLALNFESLVSQSVSQSVIKTSINQSLSSYQTILDLEIDNQLRLTID